LDKDQKNILSTLINDPFIALIPVNSDSIIVILENIRKGISSGSISVKDTDKTLIQLTETEESLDDFIKKISEYSDTFSSMKNDLNTLKPENLTSLENDFSKNTDSQNDSKLRSKTVLAEIDEINSKIPQFVSKIEDKLQIFSNTKYVISLS
jgi:hypothetical protein